MQVQKFISLQVLRGIKSRIQAGDIERGFDQDFGNEMVAGAYGRPVSAANEARTQLRILERSVDNLLSIPEKSWFNQHMEMFHQTYRTLLPTGGLQAYAEKKEKELELGLISFAAAMQEYLKTCPEAQTASINVNSLGRFLQNTLDRMFTVAKELKLEALTATLPQAMLESRQLVQEDSPKIPVFLEQAKKDGKNIYEWLAGWWQSCQAFEASPQEWRQLSLNALAGIFYGIRDEQDED